MPRAHALSFTVASSSALSFPVLPLLALALASCAHAPIDLAGCNLPMTRLAVPDPSTATGSGIAPALPASDYEAMVEAAMTAAPVPIPGPSIAPPLPAVSLFLSGGGQNGAFGAGFVDGWRAGAGGRLPDFRVVTGISTGALIGTTVFTGASERAVTGYTINSEADLLDVKARGLVAQVRAGAVGSLDPLRRRIDEILDKTPGDDALLADIAAAGTRDRRKFFVGVVDARSGDAFSIDMTAMAATWQAADTSAKRTTAKQCYIEALVASSSAPFAAPPVYIDGRMLIDGGVRFGIFRTAENRAFVRALARARTARGPEPINFLIVNGRRTIEPQCRFEEVISAGGQKECPETGVLRKWNILELGFRSIDILTNQIYLFSAQEAAAGIGKNAFVRIEADAPGHVFDSNTCQQWRAIDERDTPKPVQFHKREMLCLIDYGRRRAETEKWWQLAL